MAVGRTDEALRAFESALALSREAEFPRYLELGVLYLATRDFESSRDALDRVRDDHPDYAMAIFKRAQVGMLLGEESRLERVASARRLATERGDQAVLELIENEPLFAIQ